MVNNIPAVNSTAFDAFAEDYDDNFTNSTLGKLLRPRVWQKLGQHFRAGNHILELACGTGEDALWLARQGISVTATDGAAGMTRLAKAKAEEAGLANGIDTIQASIQEISRGKFDDQPKFDGVYSNFGGLNTVDSWPLLAEALSRLVKPGGKLILVPMGPVCPWEILWYLFHGQPRVAFRRFRRDVSAVIGDEVIPIWYPSTRRLRYDFAPWFEHLQTESLGLWLPPSYLDHWVNRWSRLFTYLNRLEITMAHLTRDWGDHYVVIFQRRDD